MQAITPEKVKGKFTFRFGVHPPHRKNFSESCEIEEFRLKSGQTVVVPLSQHIGAPCESAVEKKQQVIAGQLVGKSDAFVSAPVFSPVNGTVTDISPQPVGTGGKVLSIVITVGEEKSQPTAWKELKYGFDINSVESESIVDSIREAGIVGQGGAAFPTAVKLVKNQNKPIDTVILNACECEPYLTCDYRLMLEAPNPMVAGLQLAMRAAGAEKGIIAIEDNKPEAINEVMLAIRNLDNIQLAICKTKYPQGGERQLINAVLGRVVPTGGLPLDVGVVVVNAGTASSIYWACADGRPLTERIVTVTGAGISKAGNFRASIGMLISDLIEHCGGLTEDAEKVLLGGPMTGAATGRLDVPILKGTSGITVLTRDDVAKEQEVACIRCSRCVDHCPLKLAPTRIAHAVKARAIDLALEYDLQACIECGCCAFVCPSKIPLVQYMKSGKVLARNQK